MLFLVLTLVIPLGCGRKSADESDQTPPVPFPGIVVKPPEKKRTDEPAVVTTPKTSAGVRMPAGTPSVAQLTFAGGEDGFVGLISYSLGGPGVRVTVARSSTGEAVGTVEVPFQPENGMALSPDGKRLAVMGLAPFDGHPVTLFEVGKAGPGVKFTPYGKGKDGVRGPALVFIGFAGHDRMITVNESSGFDIWSVPSLKRLAGQPGRPASSTPFVSNFGVGYSPLNLGLAPDGKTLAVFDGTAFTFYDTATAAPKARTQPIIQPNGSINFWGSAMTADGTKFACICSVYSPKEASALLVWDTASGKRLTTTNLSQGGGGGFGWWGPDHLALFQGGQAQVDVMSIQSGKVASHVQGQGLMILRIAAATPGDKLWYVVDSPGFDPRGAAPVLVKVPIPPHLRSRLTIGPDGLGEK
jgi:hypothetical protein